MKTEEMEITRYLRRGKRVNMSEIARELKLPISTVRDRIFRIENKYVMKRSSLLDYEKLDYHANAMLALRVDSKQCTALLDFLNGQDCVNSIYRVNSNYNYLVEIVCKDRLSLIDWIESVKTKFPLEVLTFQILKVEAKEVFLPN